MSTQSSVKSLTLLEVLRVIHDADSLFRRAALAWERGNNSGDSDYLTRCEKQCDSCRERAEAKLKPFGITVDYPGLYPSFKVGGYTYNTTESAVAAVVTVTVIPTPRIAPPVKALPTKPDAGRFIQHQAEDDMGCKYWPGRDELRVLPIGGDSNAILCHAGYIEYLRDGHTGPKLPTWNSLKVYNVS